MGMDEFDKIKRYTKVEEELILRKRIYDKQKLISLQKSYTESLEQIGITPADEKWIVAGIIRKWIIEEAIIHSED